MKFITLHTCQRDAIVFHGFGSFNFMNSSRFRVCGEIVVLQRLRAGQHFSDPE